MHVNIVSYNVQSPDLPSDTAVVWDESHRFGLVLQAILTALANPNAASTFVCLQEVCQLWLHRFVEVLGHHGMAALVHNYAPPFRAPLFSVIFFPFRFFTVQTMLPLHYTHHHTDEAAAMPASARQNAVLAAVFVSRLPPRHQHRQLPPLQPFVVATYHAPCLFRRHPRAHELHITNALQFLARMTEMGLPAVLAGDFNMLPSDAAYLRNVHGSDCVDAMHAIYKQHMPTNSCPKFTGCLDYVFHNRHFRSLALSLHNFLQSKVLSEAQPSDHALVQAVLRLLPAAAAAATSRSTLAR